MPKYEYRYLGEHYESTFLERLNQLGQEGWKTVCFTPENRLLLCRKIKNDKGTIPPEDTNPSLLMEQSPNAQPDTLRQQ